MNQHISRFTATIALVIALGCGGMTASEPTYGEVAFQTYKGKRAWFKFQNSTKVTITNKFGKYYNSSIDATYEQNGDEIVIHWGDIKEFDTRESKMRMVDDCQLAEYWVQNADGSESDDSGMFTKDDSRCRGR